jgi:hypothetical protein
LPWGPTYRTTGRSMMTRPSTAVPSPSPFEIFYISRYYILICMCVLLCMCVSIYVRTFVCTAAPKSP